MVRDVLLRGECALNREELAWAAGFFDGEGHTGVVKPYNYPQMEVEQKYLPALQRFFEAVGGLGKITAYDKPLRPGRGGGVYYRWYAHKAAREVFELLRPWLSPVKLAQAEAAFAKRDAQDVVEMARIFEMPSKWTFGPTKVRAWVESKVEGHTLNLFGGQTRLDGDVIYNDLDETLPADLRLDATQPHLWEEYRHQFDTVIFDPPFSDHQAVVSYGIKRQQRVTLARETVVIVLRPGGRVLSFGYNRCICDISKFSFQY